MAIKRITQLSPKHKESIDPTTFNWEDEADIPKTRITRYCSKPAELNVLSISPKFHEH